ncbi:hypothetical protein [Stygiolobus caldivivus]|uniref:Uncharacterized protein n=1 Tax=Stygiolobus caldivivus TaxID=2824673 RepID=A0A8D5U6L0_9CREN|nr:hypothetical protein [Stygiolobus caldivivus]BCU69938.1 hypothetical protein KN1_12350 [Stygiolobus caldivivus]
MVHVFRHQLDKDTSISLPASGKSGPTLVLGLGPVFLHIPLNGNAKSPYISFPGSSVQVENNFNLEHHVITYPRKGGYEKKRARYGYRPTQGQGAKEKGAQGSKQGSKKSQEGPRSTHKARSGVYHVPGVPGVGRKPRHTGK